MTAALAVRIAVVIHRHMSDLRFQHGTEAAEAAAFRVLADRDIADGLRALPVLAAIRDLHQPRTWRGGGVTVCDHCQTAWPCDTARLAGAQTPARPSPVLAGPSGLPTDEFAAVSA